MKKLLGVVVFALMLPVGANAALFLTPGTAACGASPCLAGSGPENNTPDILTAISGIIGGTTEIYKSEVGGGDLGPAADWYTTTFSNDPLDPQDALIEWDGLPDPFISDTPIYLLVKDGKHDPGWFLFDISSWDGQMDISLTGFWPDKGAISHISIFAGEGCEENCTILPEPGPLGLLGIGLIVLYIGRRRRFVS